MEYTTSMMQCYNTKMQFQIFTENQHQQNANPPAWSHFLDDVSCVRFVGQTHSLYTLSQVIILACGHAYCEGILETTLKMHFLSQPQLPSSWQYLSKSASTPFLLTTHFLCVVLHNVSQKMLFSWRPYRSIQAVSTVYSSDSSHQAPSNLSEPSWLKLFQSPRDSSPHALCGCHSIGLILATFQGFPDSNWLENGVREGLGNASCAVDMGGLSSLRKSDGLLCVYKV